MAAYNWVQFEARCPVCLQSGPIRAQLHVAASFAGDGQGRFCNRDYRPGEQLRWWGPAHPQHDAWADAGQRWSARPDRVRECCRARCAAHDDALYAVVEVSGLVITGVVECGAEQHWPPQYRR